MFQDLFLFKIHAKKNPLPTFKDIQIFLDQFSSPIYGSYGYLWINNSYKMA